MCARLPDELRAASISALGAVLIRFARAAKPHGTLDGVYTLREGRAKGIPEPLLLRSTGQLRSSTRSCTS